MLLFIASSFCPLGILSASFILVYKKGDPIFLIISGMSALLGGVYYPISVLPDWLQKVSMMLPITSANSALRKSIGLGYSEVQLLPEITYLLVLTAILFPVALIAFRWAIRQAKIQGTLSHF